MTIYTRETGYRPWEEELLELDESPAPSIPKVTEDGTTIYTVHLVEAEDGGYGAKVVELPDIEVWGDQEDAVIEGVLEGLDAHFWQLKTKPDFRIRVETVGIAEFGPRCYERDAEEDEWEEEIT
jgi:hypothetical protein